MHESFGSKIFLFCSFKGNPLLKFRDLSKVKGKQKFNTPFNFFITIAMKDGEFSCPIYLNKPLIRKCFNMQMGEKNVSIIFNRN